MTRSNMDPFLTRKRKWKVAANFVHQLEKLDFHSRRPITIWTTASTNFLFPRRTQRDRLHLSIRLTHQKSCTGWSKLHLPSESEGRGATRGDEAKAFGQGAEGRQTVATSRVLPCMAMATATRHDVLDRFVFIAIYHGGI